MKQLTKILMPVVLDGISDMGVVGETISWAEIDHVTVVFSQYKGGAPLKVSVYGDGGDIIRNLPQDEDDTRRNATPSSDILYIPWSRAETKKFRPGASFWMDVRPTLVSGYDLEVAPVELTMGWTLFTEAIT